VNERATYTKVMEINIVAVFCMIRFKMQILYSYVN